MMTIVWTSTRSLLRPRGARPLYEPARGKRVHLFILRPPSGHSCAPSGSVPDMRDLRPLVSVAVLVVSAAACGPASFPDQSAVSAAQATYCQALAKVAGAGD